MTLCTTHIAEGNHHKGRVIAHLLEYLDQMISAGTITIADMLRRFYGTSTPANRDTALRAIRAFLLGIAEANVGKTMTTALWGGDEELFATVRYTREPLFIITEAADQSTSVLIIWLDRDYPGGPEHIDQLMPEAGEAYEILRTFLRHRTVPMILTHTTSNGSGHFNSMRCDESFYAAWTEDDPSGDLMRARKDQVLAQLGWYVAPHEDKQVPRYVPEQASSSVYTSSAQSVIEFDDTPLSAIEPLSPVANYSLLSSLNPRRRRRGPLANFWEQGERLNLVAYRDWDTAQPGTDVRSEPDTVNAGCRYWSSQTSQLVALLRALPYTEVAMSLMPTDLLLRLGNELNDLTEDSSVPAFVHAEDPVDARRQWARLVALVVVASDDDLIDLHSVAWLRSNPLQTTAALHDVSLYDWTVVATITRLSDSTPPTCSTAAVLPSGHRA